MCLGRRFADLEMQMVIAKVSFSLIYYLAERLRIRRSSELVGSVRFIFLMINFFFLDDPKF